MAAVIQENMLLSPCDSCVTISDNNYNYNSTTNAYGNTNTDNNSYPTTNLQSILYSNFDETKFHQQLIETFLHSRSKLSSHSILNNHIEPTTTTEQEITLIFNENNQILIKLSSILNLINTFLNNHGDNNQLDTKDLTINHLIIYLYYNQLTLFSLDSIVYVNQFNLFHLGKCYKFNHSKVNWIYLHNLKLNHFNTFLLSIIQKPQSNAATNVYKYFNIDNYLCESLNIPNKSNHRNSTTVFSKSVVNLLVKKMKQNPTTTTTANKNTSHKSTIISKSLITTTSSVHSTNSSLSSASTSSTNNNTNNTKSTESKPNKFKLSLKKIFA